MNSNKSFPNVPWMTLSYGKTHAVGVIAEDFGGRQIRIKGMADSTIRLASQPNSVIAISANETEYFFVPENELIEVISGSINIMC